MFESTLQRMRQAIRERRYVMTDHAEEEMDEDSLTAFDVESGILTGEIVERQRDRDTGEWKYLIHGETVDGEGEVDIVTKIGLRGTLVVITVFRPSDQEKGI